MNKNKKDWEKELLQEIGGVIQNYASDPSSLPYEYIQMIKHLHATLEQFIKKEIEKAEERGARRLAEKVKESLSDCSGCTDPRSEGTHQGFSRQHFDEIYLKN